MNDLLLRYSLAIRAMMKNRQVEIWIFCVLFFTYAYFYNSGGHNAAARFDSIRSFLETGSLITDTYCYNSADLIQFKEHYYSSKASGTFWLGLLPFFFFSKILGFILLDKGLLYQWACYLTCVFSIGTLSAATGVLLYCFSRDMGWDIKKSLSIVLCLTLATMFFPFSSLFLSHNATAFCLFAGFYLLYTCHRKSEKSSNRKRWSRLLAGLCLGFAITLEYPAILACIILVLYDLGKSLLTGKKPTPLLLLLGIVGGVLPALWYSHRAFGDIFYVTYEAYAKDPHPAFNAHSQGILGIKLPFFYFSFWPTFFHNLACITVGSLRGLLYLNPVLWLAVAGFLSFCIKFKTGITKQPEELACLLIAITYLTLNASYGDSIVYWGGGYSFGPRHLMVIIPFLALPLLRAMQIKPLGYLFWPLLAISLSFCWMAVAIDPLTPYSPDHPITEYYLPRLLKGEFATGTSGVFSDTFITKDSVSFNWGKLLGLNGWKQFVPLVSFWGVGLALLLIKIIPSSNQTIYQREVDFMA